MKRIILFRFHRDPSVCQNRIQLLQLFNPGIEIFGLYGGKETDFQKFRQTLGNDLKHIYCIRGKNNKWKWRYGDMAIGLWYMDYGNNLSFDMLHIIEWDMLFFDSISKIYNHIPENGVGLSGLIPVKDIRDKWSWTSKEPLKSEWEKLFSLVKAKFNYNMEPYACAFPGACFPKNFIEQYSKIDLPELSNDELRIPLLAQIYGFQLYDTGFFKRDDKNEEKFFNVETVQIETATIKKEISKPSGRKVFHPYTKVCFKMVDFNSDLRYIEQ